MSKPDKESLQISAQNQPDYLPGKNEQEAEENITKLISKLAAQILEVENAITSANASSLPALIAKYKGLVGQIERFAFRSRAASTAASAAIRKSRVNNAISSAQNGMVSQPDSNANVAKPEPDENIDKIFINSSKLIAFATMLDEVSGILNNVKFEEDASERKYSQETAAELIKLIETALKAASKPMESFSKAQAISKDKGISIMRAALMDKFSGIQEKREEFIELGSNDISGISGMEHLSSGVRQELQYALDAERNEFEAMLNELEKKEQEKSNLQTEEIIDKEVVDTGASANPGVIGANTFGLGRVDGGKEVVEEEEVEEVDNGKLGTLKPTHVTAVENSAKGIGVGGP